MIMGNFEPPKPYKLFCAIMYAPDKIDGVAIETALIARFGSIDSRSEEIPFNHSDYYQNEMGPGLRKLLVSFDHLTDNENLAEIKIITNRIENEFKAGAIGRLVNLDPGYLTLAKVTLFTTKDYGHRIYLGRGIHCEVTLVYRGRSYEPLAWTYPDYKEPAFIEFFNNARAIYKRCTGGS